MKSFNCILIAVAAVGMTTGCSSSSSDGSSLALSGSITTIATRASGTEDGFTVDITDYTVTCATMSPPVQSGSGAIAADGTFDVSIPGATNKPLSCFLVDGSDTKVADFLITSTEQDLSGNSTSSTTTATYAESADLGSISFDPNAGEVTVPIANIASAISTDVPTAANVFDPTGSWTIGNIDFTVPKGVKAACAQSDNQCNGPPSGQTLYLKLWKGVKTTPDASDVFGLQVWDSPGQFTSCGEKIGLDTTMKAAIAVDFSANGTSADDVFTFSSSVPNFEDQISNAPAATVTLLNNWKMNTAKMQHDYQPNCGPQDITAGSITYSNAWVCGPDTSGADYQAQLGGGCQVLATGQNVDIRDWSAITCPPGPYTPDVNGIQSNTCTGSPSIDGVTTPVTCSNKWAVVDVGGTVNPSGDFNWSEMAGGVSSGGGTVDCSAMPSGTAKTDIAQLQCYAEYYDRSGMRDAANVCLPRVDMDWTATTAANFINVDLIRPQGLVFFERFIPLPDGSGGAMNTRQEHFEGVQVGNSWVNCRVIESGGLSIKKISATKMLATYTSSTITTSTSKPACLGRFNGARETFMFYLTK